MTPLAVLTVVVGLLCLLDLVLTFGVIRRLREHGELIARSLSTAPPVVAVRAPGESVAPFATTTVDGEPLSRDALPERSLVGFFSPGCAACAESLPAFRRYAEEFPGGREAVLAVVVGSAEETAAQRRELGDVARVVVEAVDGPVGAALGVQAFPAFAVLDGAGRVVASGLRLDDVAAPAAR
jgi:thiol-disulfide isomerase/thioredoxin